MLDALPPDIAVPLRHLVDAAGPDHIFSCAAAHRFGLTNTVLERLVRSGALVRLTRGWYTLPGPALDAKERHRRTAIAVIRRHEGRVVASHYTALVLLGAPVLGADLATVHLTHRTERARRCAGGQIIHGADASVRTLTPTARTVDIAHACVQAGMLSGPLATLIAADHALHVGLTTTEQLELAAAGHRGCPGIAAIRHALTHADGRSESPVESVARYALRLLGYDVIPQHPVVAEGRRYRVDLALPEVRLAVEIDGRSKYAGTEPSRRNGVIMLEKARAAALNRAGWTIIRLTWPEIVAPGNVLRLDNLDHIIRGQSRTPDAAVSQTSANRSPAPINPHVGSESAGTRDT